MKIILREFHFNAECCGAMPTEEEGEREKEEGEREKEEAEENAEEAAVQGLPTPFFLPSPLCRDRFSFCFHARRPEGVALKPSCNPGDAIK